MSSVAGRLGAVVVALGLITSLAGCGQSKVHGPASGMGGSSSPGGSSAPGAGGAGGGPNVALPDSGPAEAPPADPQSCAFESLRAERVPVDLLLLVDASSSMAAPGAGTTVSK